MAWTCFRSSVPSTWPCVVTACSAAAWSTSISRPEIVSVQFVSLGKSRQSTTFRVMSPSVEQWQLWRTRYARGTARKAAPRVHVVARGVELDGSAGFPVLVQGALRLDQPYDASDERQEDPQAGDSADRLLGSRCLVHVPDLGRHDERVHDADEDGEDQPDGAQRPSNPRALSRGRGQKHCGRPVTLTRERPDVPICAPARSLRCDVRY